MSDEPDQTFERDDEGRFKNPTLSKSRARKLNRMRWEKARAVKEGELESLLLQSGFDPDNPPTLQKVLAELVVSRGPRSVAAAQALQKSRRDVSDPGEVRLWPGTNCPTCGSYIWQDEEAMRSAARLFARIGGMSARQRDKLTALFEKIDNISRDAKTRPSRASNASGGEHPR